MDKSIGDGVTIRAEGPRPVAATTDNYEENH